MLIYEFLYMKLSKNIIYTTLILVDLLSIDKVQSVSSVWSENSLYDPNE